MPPTAGSTGVSAQAASVSRSVSAAGSRTFMGASVSAVRTWTPSVRAWFPGTSGAPARLGLEPSDQQIEAELELLVGVAFGEVRRYRHERLELIREGRNQVRVGLQVRLVGSARDRAELHHHEPLDVAA